MKTAGKPIGSGVCAGCPVAEGAGQAAAQSERESWPSAKPEWSREGARPARRK